MPKSGFAIGVPAGRRAEIEQFLREEAIGWTITDVGSGTINIVEVPEPGQTCDRRILFPQGRIDCATALALAEEHEIESQSVGRLMNLLAIRIGKCQLGCFQ